MNGQMVPAKVAEKSPGVSTWNANREAFAFWAQRRPAFLFIPIHNIAELRLKSE